MVPGFRDWRSAAMVAVSELVSGLDAELVRLGYTASTMVWYGGCWRRLERFFASRGVQQFSLDLAMAWVDAQRFRGAWGGAAPLFPNRGQADWRRDRHAGEVPGVA